MNVFELFATLKLDDAQYKRGLSTAESNLKSFGSRAQRIGGTLTRSLSAPLAALGGGIIAVTANFEGSMNRVLGITQATGEEFDQLSKLARDLGETTQFSASQAADGMGFLAQAGFEVNEIMDALPGTLELAAAGQLSLAEAADLASNVLTGFGLEAEEIGRVNDVLAKAATTTNTNVRQLGEGFSFVAPVAAGLGVSVEEAGAAMGILSNAGIQATRAGTGLRRILTTLVNESDDLGISVTEADGSLRPFADIMEDLEATGLDTADMLEIFGDRGGPAISALLAEGSDALRDLQSELENAGGTAADLAETQMQGLPGAFRELRSAIEGAAIGIGEAGLADLVENIADMITNAVREFNALDDDTKNLIVTIGALATALGPLVTVLGFVATGVGAILSPVGLLVAALGFTVGGLAYMVIENTAAFGKLKSATDDAMESTQDFADMADDVVLDDLDSELDKIAQTLSDRVRKNFDDGRQSIVDFVTSAEDASVALAQVNLGAQLAESADDRTIAQRLGFSGGVREAFSIAQQLDDEFTGTFEEVQTLLATGQLEQAYAILRDVQRLVTTGGGGLTDLTPDFGRGVTENINAFTSEVREAIQAVDTLKTETEGLPGDEAGVSAGQVTGAAPGTPRTLPIPEPQIESPAARDVSLGVEDIEATLLSAGEAYRSFNERRRDAIILANQLYGSEEQLAAMTEQARLKAEALGLSMPIEETVAANASTSAYTDSLDQLRAMGAEAAQKQKELRETVAISDEQMKAIRSNGLQQFVSGLTDLGVQAANTEATVGEAFALMALKVIDSILQQIIALQVRLIAEQLFAAGTLNFVKLGAAVAASIAVKGLANSLKNQIASRSTAEAPASSGVPASVGASSPEANAVIDRLDNSVERFGTYVEQLVTEGIRVRMDGAGSRTAALRS